MEILADGTGRAAVKEKFLADLFFSISYEKDADVRHKQRVAEEAFKDLFSGQSIATNLSDTDAPERPRILMRSGKKILTISQVAAQLRLNFDATGIPMTEQLNISETNVAQFERGFAKFAQTNNTREIGIIASLNYPGIVEEQKLHEYIFNRFLKLEPRGKIASAGFNVGFKTPGNLFLNFFTSAYELREAELAPGQTSVNLNSLPIQGWGIELKLDINNKPMLGGNEPITYTLTQMFKVMKETIEHQADEFIGYPIEV